MKVKIYKTIESASEEAFRLVAEAKNQGAKNFGLATGSSPEGLYALMCQSDLNFSDCIAINLDEYYGLSPDHEQSYAYFMREHLFEKKPFKETHIPDGTAKDIQAETERYNQILDNYPIDLQILGIGPNGHIGFNEPGTPFDSLTHHVELTPSTIQANKRFFPSEDDVPTHALSMGIASIMEAKQIIMLAFGEGKAEAVQGMVEGEIYEGAPASILQKHPDVTILLDEDAAKLLKGNY